MSKSYQVTVCFLSLIVLTACESDAKKLQRLQGDQAIACLNAQSDKRVYELAKAPLSPPSNTDSLALEWRDWETKCELATRDLNRFMR